MVKRLNKLSGEWIRASREEFRTFLEETHFPNPRGISLTKGWI